MIRSPRFRRVKTESGEGKDSDNFAVIQSINMNNPTRGSKVPCYKLGTSRFCSFLVARASLAKKNKADKCQDFIIHGAFYKPRKYVF
jgi:hypothetical protein